MEVVLAHAQQQGAVFSEDLPLIPTLHDVKRLQSRAARDEGAAQGGAACNRRVRKSIMDHSEAGEFTCFQGKGKDMYNSSPVACAVYNAVGFFLYTQCRANATAEWPAVLCACLVTTLT
jgi:hypothetical protein